MPDPPEPVQDKFEQLQEQKDSYLQLRNISGGWYVQRSTSVWDKEEKKPKKVTTHLGTITDDGEFVPKKTHLGTITDDGEFVPMMASDRPESSRYCRIWTNQETSSTTSTRDATTWNWPSMR